MGDVVRAAGLAGRHAPGLAPLGVVDRDHAVELSRDVPAAVVAHHVARAAAGRQPRRALRVQVGLGAEEVAADLVGAEVGDVERPSGAEDRLVRVRLGLPGGVGPVALVREDPRTPVEQARATEAVHRERAVAVVGDREPGAGGVDGQVAGVGPAARRVGEQARPVRVGGVGGDAALLALQHRVQHGKPGVQGEEGRARRGGLGQRLEDAALLPPDHGQPGTRPAGLRCVSADVEHVVPRSHVIDNSAMDPFRS